MAFVLWHLLIISQLLSHIPSLLFHLMYVNKHRFAENNREKVLLCAQTVVPLHRQKTNIDCLG